MKELTPERFNEYLLKKILPDTQAVPSKFDEDMMKIGWWRFVSAMINDNQWL